MTHPPRILSTKKLSLKEKKHLLEANISYEDNNFIDIQYLKLRKNMQVKNAIFSSQNAVKSILANQTKICNAYCVGLKTSALLVESRIPVERIELNSEILGNTIVSKYADREFIFFCGNRRMDNLPNILRENKVSITEVEVYKTTLNPKGYTGRFDGILFFSPSAVESFIMKNEPSGIAFCIGDTSAKAAQRYFPTTITAEDTTVESSISRVINYFK